MSAGTDWGEQIVRAGGINLVEYQRDWMSLPRETRDAIRHFAYPYASPYRPLAAGAKLGQPFEHVAVRGGTRGIVLTASPLDIETIARFELIPVGSRPMGTFILDVSRARGDRNLELLHEDGERVAALFRNPRGIWQLSYFEARIGPTGHLESTEEVPTELVWPAFAAKFRTFTQGAVDAIMETL